MKTSATFILWWSKWDIYDIWLIFAQNSKDQLQICFSFTIWVWLRIIFGLNFTLIKFIFFSIWKNNFGLSLISFHPFLIKNFLYFFVFFKNNRLCPGGELFDFLVIKKKFNEEEARKVFIQIALAISYCHSKGICHRDLKPENFLLCQKDSIDSIKVADFGLSCIFQDKSN